MKTENDKKWGTVIIAVVGVITLICLGFLFGRPYAYVKRCAKENEKELALITAGLKETYSSGDTHIRYVTDGDVVSPIEADAPEEIKTVLMELQDKYQKDQWPVFSYVEVYYDEQGDMMYQIRVKTEKTAGEGMEGPDLRCYYLIYIDDGYDGKQIETNADVIFDNWHYWSKDAYSG